MSMLSTQCANLRTLASELEQFTDGCIGRTREEHVMLISSVDTMREAADTIESLSAKLASCWDTCHVVSSRWDELMEEQCVELSCGHSVWGRDAEPPNYCPDCGKKVEQ